MQFQQMHGGLVIAQLRLLELEGVSARLAVEQVFQKISVHGFIQGCRKKQLIILTQQSIFSSTAFRLAHERINVFTQCKLFAPPGVLFLHSQTADHS